MLEKPDSEPGQVPQHAAPGQHTASQTERCTALYAALSLIPAGRVVSYGQLAAYAGLGRAARWVGRTLSRLPDGTTLPWHRVICAGGRLGLPAASQAGTEQRSRLREEGVQIHNDRVDMPRYGWRPTEHSG
ncbi:MGMT family protein [Pseudomonas spirodelae]|uniref:MGMT family protein n=1 Tax=Pseudomonas spirodelae TaxID=3101751 RepID=UPI00398C43DF